MPDGRREQSLPTLDRSNQCSSQCSPGCTLLSPGLMSRSQAHRGGACLSLELEESRCNPESSALDSSQEQCARATCGTQEGGSEQDDSW